MTGSEAKSCFPFKAGLFEAEARGVSVPGFSHLRSFREWLSAFSIKNPFHQRENRGMIHGRELFGGAKDGG
jgi:hypothetical protein